jgi:L-alanine-DL-glutamate epimerase-like enolase superfamily enzyme
VNVDRFSLPLDRPLSTAHAEITEREGFLVTVDATDVTARAPPGEGGSTAAHGLGEATPLPGWTESLDECEAALDGVDDPVGDLDALPPAARHGVSLALLDARARAASEPLYRYLGRDERVDSVPVNATVGDGPPAETAAAVESAVDAGFPAVKVKVGARSPSADRDRLAAAREACPDVELRVDANGAWDRETARLAVEALAPLDVAYVEQPLPADDLEGNASLAGGDVGVALDEGLYEHGFDAALSAGVDVLVLKPMAMGGPDLAVEAAVLARGAGVDPVVTTTVDGAVARAAAVHAAAAVPDVRACGLATGDRITADLLHDPAPVENGSARVPQKEGNTPGLSTEDDA